jgi:hypothetical protein
VDWLDVAIMSNIQEIRNMNRVYSTAAVTLFCDRLLLSVKGGTDRDKAAWVFGVVVSCGSVLRPLLE